MLIDLKCKISTAFPYKDNVLVFQSAMAEYHRLGSLNNRNFSLTVLEARKSKIRVLTDLVSGESLLPDS